MKKIFATIMVLILLAAVIFGWSKTVSLFKGGRRLVNEQVDQNTPSCLKVARIQELVADETRGVEQERLALARFRWQAQDLVRTIADQQQSIEQLRRTLTHVRALLAGNQDTYAIGRQTFSQAEIREDAVRKLDELNRMQASLGSSQQLLRNLEDTVARGEAALKQKQHDQQIRKNQFELARVEDTVASIRLDIADMQDRSSVPSPVGTELGNALREFSRSVREKNELADQRLNAGSTGIDYAPIVPPKDILESIDRVLAPTKSPSGGRASGHAGDSHGVN